MGSRASAGRREEERGAVAVMTAAIVMVLVLVAAFAVDLGMQRVARADMQSLADVVALDLVRELDGQRTVAELSPLMPALAQASRSRNSGTLGAEPELEVELGRLEDDGTFVPLSGTAVPTAVRVTSATEVGFAFVPGSGGAVRSAVADLAAGACFTIGSYAARLDTGESPILGPLLGALGSGITLSAADYNGLANAEVDLVDLLGVEVGAVTLEEAVRGNQLVGLRDYYLAVADVLERESGSTAQVELLERLAGSVGAVQLQAADLLGLDTGGSAGLDAALNVFDLVTAGAAAANGQNGLSLPATNVNLGPLASVRSSISVIEPLKQGCGRKNNPGATASSTQGTATLSASAADVNVPGLLRTRVSVSGTVKAASAKGRLTDVRCDPLGVTVAVSDGLLDIDLTLEVTVFARVLFVEIPVVRGPIRIRGSKDIESDVVVDVIGEDYDTGALAGYGSSGLPALSVDTSGLALVGLPVGIVLGPILNALTTGLVNPLIASLDDLVVAPLLNSLGIDLSGADVRARPTPKCGEPALRG